MPRSRPLFSISNLVKTFSPGKGIKVSALSGVTMEIREGEFLLIAGANGSGKTVLMLILAGLMDPDKGDLLFRGQPLSGIMGELRRHLGLVFQDPDAQTVGETVAEDIAFGPKNLGLSKPAVLERVQNALEALGLEHKRDWPPRNLSGGEKRRLAVAGILAMGCGTIIMDEPFANLDWPGVVQVLEIIRQLKNENKTVILLTHELEKVLAFADRLVILDRGIIREDGKPADVLDRLKDTYGVRDPRRNYDTVEDCTWL
jgi:biotin transport system ATP-binding protein